MALLALKQSPSFLQSSLTERFQLILINFAKHLELEGISIRPCSPEAISIFESLEEAKKESIVSDLLTYYSVCQDFLTTEPTLRKSSDLIRKMLQNQGWTIDPSFFDTIEDEDIIEMYRTDFTQVFRNIKFLELCSYSLSDLYVQQWFDLYMRPQSITDQLIKVLVEDIFPNKQSLHFSHVPDHFLEERKSEKKNLLQIRQKVLAPIYENGEVFGFIGTLQANLIGSKNEELSTLNVRPLSL